MSTDTAFWDGIAESYAAKPVDDPEAFERKIEITLSHLRPTDVVLDVGCGTGSLALRLAHAAREVHGLDVSPEMIRIARDKARDAPNVHFHVGAWEEGARPLECAPLDCILAYSLLHLVPDRAAALDLVWRSLKPGGTFISSTVCLGGSWIPYRPLLAAMYRVGKAPRVTVLTRDALLEDVRRAGFVDIATPDVGAKSDIVFATARRPA